MAGIDHQSKSICRTFFPTPTAALSATPFFVEEEGIGCWVQSDDPAVLAQGQAFESQRFALHIPSQTREHAPLPPGQIAAFEAAARAIRLKQVSLATGYWTLDSGALQQEPLRIAWSAESVDEQAMRNLARRILAEGGQEAVAIEVAGRVEVIRN